MKLLATHHFLVVGALTLGLVACGSALPPDKSKELVAAGPKGPVVKDSANSSSTGELPPVIVELTEGKDTPKRPILMAPADKAPQDLDEDEVEGGELERAHGPADPLASPPLMSGTQEGRAAERDDGWVMGGVPVGVVGGVPGGIASNARGGKQAQGTSTAGDSGGKVPIIGAATEVRGSIAKADIQRVVRTHINDVKHCYEQGLTRRPDLEGKVVLKFTIGKTGAVVAATVASTTLNERQVEQCMTGAAMRWAFPKPTGEGLVVISYPFILKSAN